MKNVIILAVALAVSLPMAIGNHESVVGAIVIFVVFYAGLRFAFRDNKKPTK